MGGCRCSYRSCKATSDGNTHFFHYPVFDKHRCHQWIANAQRFDLLELKLSQLKNRVICQHHFQDNMFMNDMRNKLTHNAVPTLGGPFGAVQSLPQTPPIITTDKSVSNVQEIVRNKEKIEDDTKYFTSREKIATFSVPYNEFLKKCDLDQLNDPDLLKSMPTPRKKQTLYASRIIVTEPQTDSKTDSVDISTNNVLSQEPPQSIKKTERKYKKSNVVILAEKKITNQLPIQPSPGDLKKVSPNFIIKNKSKKAVIQPKYSDTVTANVLPNAPNAPTGKTNSNDNIIIPEYYPQNPTETKTTAQTPSLEAMTPQQTLQVYSEDSNKHLPQIISVNSIPSAANNCVVHPTVLDVEFIPEVARVPLEQAPAAATPQKPTRNPVSTCAERNNTAADIQSKSRLKEVVEKALSRLDEQRRIQLQSKSPHQVHRHQPSPISFKSKHICKNPKKPNSLTAALLSKVKENSRDIAEIKHLLQEQAKRANGKTVKTVKDKNVEVISSVERRKKYLFKEISQYLSTKLKSDLYEELFINHVVPNTRSTSSRRKSSPKFT